MEDLFIDNDVHFEKTAAEVTLPEDANAWPNEILQELFKQAPYIADFEPHVVMDRVDGEKGYGFGHFEVGNKTAMLPSAGQDAEATAGVHKVRIPIIVKLNKLQALDVLVTEDSKMLPLTEGRLRQALFRPQAFDITSQTPGDHSMIGQLYPPYRQNYGFGGGGATMTAGMGKESSARPSLLAMVLPAACGEDIEKVATQIAEDEGLQALLLKNGHSTSRALSLLASAPTDMTKKVASSLPYMIRPTVAQLQKEHDGYLLKTANHAIWAPITQHIDRGEAVRRFGGKVVLAADMNGGATITEGPEAEMPEEAAPMEGEAQLISEFGIYKVHDMEGNELLGYVFPNLLDLNGTLLPLALFTNGSQAAVQGEIVGTKAAETDVVTLPTGHPRGYGVFVRMGPEGHEATLPFELQGSFDEGGDVVMMGSTFDGQPVQVAFNQPNIDRITVDGETVLVPQDFQWLPLNKENEVALASKPEEVTKPEAEEAKEASVTVTVRSDGQGTFSFEGPALEKLAYDEKSFLSINDALFLLGGLGVGHTYGQKKLAEAVTWSQPVSVRIGRSIETAGSVREDMLKQASAALEKFPSWRRNLVKEAAAIPDPTAVDTVLSLGFLNEENLGQFISYMPSIDQAQEKMCEMLIAARLGLREIPSGALERAIRSVEEVVEGLRVMAFQQN